MPTLYALKPAFQARLRPLADRLARAGVTANQITLLAAALSIATGAAVAAFADHRAIFLLMPVVLFVRMALNAIDGMLAREHGQASKLGMYLNELCDVVSDLALILAFAVACSRPGASSPSPSPRSSSEYRRRARRRRRQRAATMPGRSARATGRWRSASSASSSPAACGCKAITPFVFPAMATLSLVTAINRIRSGLRAGDAYDQRRRNRRCIHEQTITAARAGGEARGARSAPSRAMTAPRSSTATGRPSAQPRKGAILLFHRGHEHGGRMAHLVDELAMPDHAFYAWDARGNGRSAGERGYAPSFAALVRDIDCFVREIGRDGFGQRRHRADRAILRRGARRRLGARLCADIRALVVASPAFSVKLYVPFAKEGIALWQKLKGRFFVNSYVKAKFLTHDAERIASFEADPLITRPIASNILVELYEHAARIVADARAITVPTQLLISGSDWVVRHGPQHEFFVNLGSPAKERHVLPGFFHDTLGERDRKHGARPDPAVPRKAVRRAGADDRPDRRPTAPATPATRPTGSPRRCRCCRRRASTGR